MVERAWSRGRGRVGVVEMAAFALLRRASERSSSANDDVAMDAMRAEVKGAWSSGRGRVGVVEWAWSRWPRSLYCVAPPRGRRPLTTTWPWTSCGQRLKGRGRVGVVEWAWSSGRGRVGGVEMAAFALLRRASERSSSANDDVAMDVMRAEVKGAWSSGRGRVGVV